MRKLVLICAVLLLPAGASAQGSAFNFQGRLNDGTNPANGRYDLQFRLFDAIVGGNPLGPLVPRPNTTLINGVFSVTLEFGATPFANPNSVFIEIGVRLNGSPNAYTILGPRQQLTVVPFALRATNADHADNANNALNALTAVSATTATSATLADDSLKFGGLTSSHYAKLDSISNNGDLDVQGHLGAGGDLTIQGNAFQGTNTYGFAKVMIEVINTAKGLQQRCFNSFGTGNQPCGVVLTQPLVGVYRLKFPFPITNRFVSVSAQYTNSAGNNNTGINYRPFDSTTIEVFTFAADSEDTVPRDFTIILY
jgi:hypothetical protein